MQNNTHPPPPFYQFSVPRHKRAYTKHPDARRNPETAPIENPHPTKPSVFISRQYLFMLKAKAAGRCVICGQPSYTAYFCLQHAIKQRNRQRVLIEKKLGRPCKPVSSLTTRLEAIAAGKPPPLKVNVDKEARRAAGLCIYCGLRPLATKNHCGTCADAYNARAYRYMAKRGKPKHLRFDPHAALANARAKLSTP